MITERSAAVELVSMVKNHRQEHGCECAPMCQEELLMIARLSEERVLEEAADRRVEGLRRSRIGFCASKVFGEALIQRYAPVVESILEAAEEFDALMERQRV